MSIRSLLLASLLGACIWIAGYQAIAHSSVPRKLAPPVACTSANRMDFFIDEDNIMWECSCEMLKTGNICRWQVIGGVDSPSARRLRHRYHHARLVPVLLVGAR